MNCRIGSGKINISITGSSKRKYYTVSTSLCNKQLRRYFPYTEKGLKEATLFLEKYRAKKTLEYKTKKKKVKIGILATEKYQAGLLKYISISQPRNIDKCKIDIKICQLTNIKNTTRGLTINERGFNTIFDRMVKKLIGFYNLDPEDVDTKARIEKTKEVFLEKYQAICKEHKLTFYP